MVTIWAGRRESFPLAIVRSLATGVPVVAYDIHYGPAELLTAPATGELVSSGDVNGLASALLRLVGTTANSADPTGSSRAHEVCCRRGCGPAAHRASGSLVALDGDGRRAGRPGVRPPRAQPARRVADHHDPGAADARGPGRLLHGAHRVVLRAPRPGGARWLAHRTTSGQRGGGRRGRRTCPSIHMPPDPPARWSRRCAPTRWRSSPTRRGHSGSSSPTGPRRYPCSQPGSSRGSSPHGWATRPWSANLTAACGSALAPSC